MSDSDVVMRHFDVVTHVHSCAECPDAVTREGVDVCNQAPNAPELRTQNARALSPSCPQWPGVQA